MSDTVNPIIFDLKYTPYRLTKNATLAELAAHKAERAFYDMTGEKNVYGYITTEGKRAGRFTALEYLQKSTGAFNGDGMISADEVAAMKERLKANEGNIWHGFISLNEEDSPKIDSPEKCVALIKRTFGAFLKEGGFNVKNIDLMCALHLDKPHHLHIHFVYWEKEPKTYDKHGNLTYRAKGRVNKKAIDNMYVRIAEFLSGDKQSIYEQRQTALKELREAASIRKLAAGNNEILKAVISLAKELPKAGRLSYGSKDMAPFTGRVDTIVKMLLDNNGDARRAERKFYAELEKKRQRIAEICHQPQVYGNGRAVGKPVPNESKYRYAIDEKNIHVIEDIEADYKRRQGNMVLNIATFIKSELYERKPGKKYKANDNHLKRNLSMSSKKVDSLCKRFVSSFGRESEILERDFSNRLEQIEEEIKHESEEEQYGLNAVYDRTK